jgi:cytochrome P450
MVPDWSYIQQHKPFAKFGETFLLVSPFQVVCLTDSAEAIRQVTQRREDFPKQIESYEILKQFGESVLTVEGAIWRMHRKVTSASFNEKNAALVFAEAIRQAQSMCDNWMEAARNGNKTITTVDSDTMRFALNIIGYVGFGLRLLWPGQTLPSNSDSKLLKYGSLDPPKGHTMSFVDSIAVLLDKIMFLLILPSWLLSRPYWFICSLRNNR